MMSRTLVGRVILAMGICLVLLSFAAYHACAGCNNELCEDTCAAQMVGDCDEGNCETGPIACWYCKCQANPFNGRCICTPG
jgi:hypothetical protein